MISFVGYLAYGLIVGFNAIQWFFMVRGKTINLGALPMWSLVFGLALLQLTLFWPLFMGGFVPPTYIIVGNALSFIFAALGLERVVRANINAPEPTFMQLADGTILQVIAVSPPPIPIRNGAPTEVLPTGGSDYLASALPSPRTAEQMREEFTAGVDSTIGKLNRHRETWDENGFPPTLRAADVALGTEGLGVERT